MGPAAKAMITHRLAVGLHLQLMPQPGTHHHLHRVPQPIDVLSWPWQLAVAGALKTGPTPPTCTEPSVGSDGCQLGTAALGLLQVQEQVQSSPYAETSSLLGHRRTGLSSESSSSRRRAGSACAVLIPGI